jgi:DNA-directed RNA polymerase sigma subunit (sigma70/sigma32)
MMKVLNDKERDFITRHIVNEESYYAIAETEGYTVERVRQIVTGGLKKMRNCEFAKKQFGYFLK